MNVNGIQLFTRAYASASTAASPACVAIQIGKGLKGTSLGLYKSIGKETAGSLDLIYNGGSVHYGVWMKAYDELTGVLLIDTGTVWSSAVTNSTLYYSDQTSQTSGYLVINASKSPALSGIPLLIPRIATISDVKAANTAGGTFTTGAWQTRTLNTIDDPTGIVTSLASNQFVLSAGEYYIEAAANSYRVDQNMAKIRNITDGTDALTGQPCLSGAGAGYSNNIAPVVGKIIVTSNKTFELQHRCSTTGTTIGFGTGANYGVNETYATIKITRIR
jgi:hypothetical protein